MLKVLSVEEKTGRTKSGRALVSPGPIVSPAKLSSNALASSSALGSGAATAAGTLRRGAAGALASSLQSGHSQGAHSQGSLLQANAVYPKPAVQNARVLVCDDETRLGDLTAGLLQECGFRAGFVPNAVLAMQYLEQHQDTSVLLLDVNLSGSRSTFELLTELEQRPRRPRVVLTSGSAKQDIRAELTHHPLVVGYLEKPYAEEELTSTITDAVS